MEARPKIESTRTGDCVARLFCAEAFGIHDLLLFHDPDSHAGDSPAGHDFFED
jgi:hypothetical protein